MTHTIGFIGLGHMGKNMVLRLVEKGVNVVAFNRTKEITEKFVDQSRLETRDSKKTSPDLRFTNYESNNLGILNPAYDLKELIKKLSPPRIIWLMIPNGPPVDEILQKLIEAGLGKSLPAGRQDDIVIDGGNTYYKDTIRRSAELTKKGISFIDCGTSGGLEGARSGASLMLGGDEQVVRQLDWLWKSLAVEHGYAYVGPSGAGHFVKMVHNGVEYGIDEAIGEGFEILASGPYKLDLPKVANVWAHGSVVRSWLVELLAKALEEDPTLDKLTGRVGGGETGTWALKTAKELRVETPVIERSLEARKKSLTNPTFTGKVISALRKGYGGHVEPEKNSK
jgi:6-phosphogluconate dehydrogenase